MSGPTVDESNVKTLAEEGTRSTGLIGVASELMTAPAALLHEGIALYKEQVLLYKDITLYKEQAHLINSYPVPENCNEFSARFEATLRDLNSSAQSIKSSKGESLRSDLGKLEKMKQELDAMIRNPPPPPPGNGFWRMVKEVIVKICKRLSEIAKEVAGEVRRPFLIVQPSEYIRRAVESATLIAWSTFWRRCAEKLAEIVIEIFFGPRRWS